MTVAQLERMPARELAEWEAYFELGADEAVMRGLEARALSRLESKTRKKRR